MNSENWANFKHLQHWRPYRELQSGAPRSQSTDSHCSQNASLGHSLTCTISRSVVLPAFWSSSSLSWVWCIWLSIHSYLKERRIYNKVGYFGVRRGRGGASEKLRIEFRIRSFCCNCKFINARKIKRTIVCKQYFLGEIRTKGI